MHATVRKLLGYLCAFGLIFALWYLLAIIIDSPVLPTPQVTIPIFVRQIPTIFPEFVTSFIRVVGALALGTAAGVPTALILSRFKATDAIFAPFLYITYPIPKIVFLPIFMILLGLGHAPKIALIAVAVFFQVMMTTRDAAQAVPSSLIMSARSMGARAYHIYQHVIVPATLPSLFTALRISSGTAIAILFIAESIAGTSGLGWVIADAWGVLNYTRMFSGILAMAVLGALVYEAISYCEWLCTPWRRSRE